MSSLSLPGFLMGAGTGELRAADPGRIGPYRVLWRLGSGGMGQVYLARSPGGRAVAIKVIRPDMSETRGFRARFAREVAAARGVSGMFTAAVVDADPEAELPWMATAYVEGPSLADAVEQHGPLPPEAVLSLAAGLAEGLQAIHRAGLVHRDLKPSNVLLAADGPRVIDFGISWAGDGSRLTDAGMTVGSPGFLSPEQARGQEVDPASDVFALGAVLAYAATGEGPFGDGPDQALMYRVVHEPPDLSRVPPELHWLIESCLAKKPGYRPTMDQLLDRLADRVPGSGASEARPAAAYYVEPDTPGGAYTSVDLAAPPLAEDRPPRERAARRLRLPLAAAVACVAITGGAMAALTSSPGGPDPGPASPPAVVVPAAPGTTPGTGTAARSSASPSHVATTPPGSATRPAAPTPSTAATPAAGQTSSAARPPGQSAAPPPAHPTTVPPTSAPATPAPTTPAPASSPPTHCVLIFCS